MVLPNILLVQVVQGYTQSNNVAHPNQTQEPQEYNDMTELNDTMKDLINRMGNMM